MGAAIGASFAGSLGVTQPRVSLAFFGRTIATGGIKKGDAQPKGCIKEVLGGLLIQIRRVDMAGTETKCRNA